MACNGAQYKDFKHDEAFDSFGVPYACNVPCRNQHAAPLCQPHVMHLIATMHGLCYIAWRGSSKASWPIIAIAGACLPAVIHLCVPVAQVAPCRASAPEPRGGVSVRLPVR